MAERVICCSAVPFRDLRDAEQHFEDHGHEFIEVLTVDDYVERAEWFMNGPMSATGLECSRPQGGRARYDPATDEYGAVRADGTIATYFIPNPHEHWCPSNMQYFRDHCV